ncbi:hypothetical protein Y1Q_0014842 [Alligator mississippiensis]|uniref:Uncharacterized protein n=1 Tax=Alligator mississippiensis TaxID=8496 RepID=A0A151M252_ALLMI|nr:hypothetical protein Y1Q_0014842 [Alligator mississippiensis]
MGKLSAATANPMPPWSLVHPIQSGDVRHPWLCFSSTPMVVSGCSSSGLAWLCTGSACLSPQAIRKA